MLGMGRPRKKKPTELGERIDRLMAMMEMDQAEFAEKIDVSYTTISNWRSGPQQPTAKQTFAIRDLTKINSDWILFGIEDDLTPAQRRALGLL